MSEARSKRVYARAPDRLSDVVLAVPALQRLAERYGDGVIDVWCPIEWAPVLELAGLPAAVIPFRQTRALGRTIAWLKGPSYDAAYMFTPSVFHVAATWLAGVPSRRGNPSGRNRWLLTEWAALEDFPGEHRVSAFMGVADPDWSGGRPPAPRIPVPVRAREQFEQLLGERAPRPLIGIAPGSRAPARRWSEGRFTALAGLLAEEGGTVVVFGGPGDEVLAARVAAGAGQRGLDLGGRTSIAVFAAGLLACDVVVGNDNGALHLAAAVGSPVIGVYGPRAPQETGPLTPSARVLWHGALPCAPCRRNRCPRRGSGTFLPDAHEECLNLVSVEAVAGCASRKLQDVGAARDV